MSAAVIGLKLGRDGDRHRQREVVLLASAQLEFLDMIEDVLGFLRRGRPFVGEDLVSIFPRDGWFGARFSLCLRLRWRGP